MLKIRLHGLEEEITAYIQKMEKDDSIRILSESSPYADRGKSEYVRVYLDIEQK